MGVSTSYLQAAAPTNVITIIEMLVVNWNWINFFKESVTVRPH